MKLALTTTAIIASLAAGSASAAITVSSTDLVVTDHPHDQAGVSGPAEADDAFYNSLTNVAAGRAPGQTGSNRISLDVNDVSGQSFTLASAITLDSIYLSYNTQLSTGRFDLRIDEGNNGSFDYTYAITLSALGDLQGDGGNNGPFHFIQFDVSAAEIALGAGEHSFNLLGVTDNGEGAWIIGTMFANEAYAGGSLLSSTGGAITADTSRDAFFAITAVPEPGSLALLGLGSLLIGARRRRD